MGWEACSRESCFYGGDYRWHRPGAGRSFLLSCRSRTVKSFRSATQSGLLEIVFRARKLTLVPSWAALRLTLSYGHTSDKQAQEPVCPTLFRADGWALFQARARDGPSFLRPASGIDGCAHL